MLRNIDWWAAADVWQEAFIFIVRQIRGYLGFLKSEDEGTTILRNVGNTVIFYVLLTVHLSISLDNGQRDEHLIYFTIRPLQSSTCFEHYMLIIRRLNCIVAASGIVTLSKWPSGAQVEREMFPPQTVYRTATYYEWRYQILHQYNSTSWWWAYNARNTWRFIINLL